jgi:hypothetical protein
MSNEGCCRTWKVLIYMGWGGTAGFEAEQEAVLDEISTARLEHVDVVYQLTHEHYVERGRLCRGRRIVLAKSPPVEITDPQLLTDFLDWADETFPSRYTALFAKDHGQGPIDTTPQLVLTASGIFLNARSKRYMPMPSFRRALERSRRGRVDFLGLDACRLGSIEVAYELRNVASVLVASEMSLTTTGWAYPRILTYLDHAHELATTRELALEVVRTSSEFRLVCVDLAWADEVAAHISQLGTWLIANKATVCNWVNTSFRQTYSEGVEIEWLLQELRSGVLSEHVGLLRPIKVALERALIVPSDDRRPHTEPELDPWRASEQRSYLGLFFPATKGSLAIASYGSAAFAVDTSWAEFVGTLNHWILESSSATRRDL